MKIIGIAGGSGSGKSTIAVLLRSQHPDTFALLHLDDYFKKEADAPRLDGMLNWDHPDALRFDDLYSDIRALREGKSVTVRTKGEFYNPNYDWQLGNKIEQVIEPRPVLIIEGYLVLHDERIRELLDLSFYFDISIEESAKRRGTNRRPLEPDYYEKILKPMHAAYVEPTKQYADVVLDVSHMSIQEVLDAVQSELRAHDMPNGLS